MRVLARSVLGLAIMAGAVALGGIAVSAPAAAQMMSKPYQFIKAVRDADGNKATELLNEPGSNLVNVKEVSTGKTGLQIAAERRDLTWMGFLIGKGADVNARDRDGVTPLFATAQLGFAEGAQLLIGRKARVNDANNQGETPLIRAVQNRDLRLVKLLLDAGANPDRADTLAGMTARDYAKRDFRNSAVLKAIEDKGKPAKPAMGPN